MGLGTSLRCGLLALCHRPGDRGTGKLRISLKVTLRQWQIQGEIAVLVLPTVSGTPQLCVPGPFDLHCQPVSQGSPQFANGAVEAGRLLACSQ